VSLTPQIAYANDLPIERGVLVLRVDAGGPAEAAGLEPGDVITAVARRPVRNLHHFHEALARHRIGETVEVSLWREGQTLARSAVLAEYR
jgi:S1-C subfamily serine protease